MNRIKHPSGVVGKGGAKAVKSCVKNAGPSLCSHTREISQCVATDVHEKMRGLLTPARLFWGETHPCSQETFPPLPPPFGELQQQVSSLGFIP